MEWEEILYYAERGHNINQHKSALRPLTLTYYANSTKKLGAHFKLRFVFESLTIAE